MISDSVLVGVAAAEAVVAIALVLVLLARGAIATRRADACARALARARRLLAAHLDGDPTVGDELAGLPAGVARTLLLDSAIAVRQHDRTALLAVADATGVAAHARRQLRSRWWWRRLAAADLLAAVDERDVALRAVALADRHAHVRALAAEWVAATPSGDDLVRLTELLGDPHPLVRHSATDSLLRVGSAATAAVAAALGADDARLPALLAVATRRPDPSYLPAILAAAGSVDAEARRAAARALGVLGGDDGGVRLVAMLGDEDSGVRCAAATALGALGRWATVPQLAARLADPAFAVRRAAGEALASLGAPGVVALRGATRSDDPVAAGMATLVLDVRALRAGTRPPT